MVSRGMWRHTPQTCPSENRGNPIACYEAPRRLWLAPKQMARCYACYASRSQAAPGSESAAAVRRVPTVTVPVTESRPGNAGAVTVAEGPNGRTSS